MASHVSQLYRTSLASIWCILIFDANTVFDLSALHFTNVVSVIKVSVDVQNSSVLTIVIPCNHSIVQCFFCLTLWLLFVRSCS